MKCFVPVGCRLSSRSRLPNGLYDGNGVGRNLDSWYKAFEVKPVDKLHLPPHQLVRMWN